MNRLNLVVLITDAVMLLTAYFLSKIGKKDVSKVEVTKEMWVEIEKYKVDSERKVREYQWSNPYNGDNIVNCKDCSHRGDSSKCPMMYPDNSPYYPDTDWTEDEGYCHLGKRREE